MIRVDHHIEQEEGSALGKIVTGLSFSLHKIDKIIDESITVDLEKTDLGSFILGC